MSPRRTLIASALLSLAVPAWAQDTADTGKAIADAKCNSCHAIQARTGSGYTPEGWDTVLRMMTNLGVPITPAEMAPLKAHLVKTYPVKGRPDAVIVNGPLKVYRSLMHFD